MSLTTPLSSAPSTSSASHPTGQSMVGFFKKESLAAVKHSLCVAQKNLNFLERWELSHYKEPGFWGWIARFILSFSSSSQARFKDIEQLKSQILSLSSNRKLVPFTPTIITSAWKPSETARLKELYEMCGDNYWSYIAQQLGRTPKDVEEKLYSILEREMWPTRSSPLFDSSANSWGRALVAIKSNAQNFSKLDPIVQNNREFVLGAVKMNGLVLKLVDDLFKADKEVVLASVSKHGYLLHDACYELRQDRDVVLAAVKNYGAALSSAPSKLQADKEIVLAAVKNDGQIVRYASDELKADKEVVLAAVKRDGFALHYLGAKPRADKDIVLAAVSHYAFALQFASPELKADKEVVLAAVKENGQALKHASDTLQKDPDVLAARRFK